MRKTKKITLSAMLVALGAAFMILGAVIEMFDLTVCAIASLCVAFAYLELGSPYTWLIWICTSLSTALMFPGSMIWAEYLFVFGIYPILKAYIERLPRWSWIPVKLVYINSIVWILIFVVDAIFGTPFLDADTPLLWAATYLLVNVAFFAYDMFITVIVRLYFAKYRKSFKKFLE